MRHCRIELEIWCGWQAYEGLASRTEYRNRLYRPIVTVPRQACVMNFGFKP